MIKNVIFLIFFINSICIGQEKSPLFLTLSNKGGIMTAHRPFMKHLVRERTYGFELSLSKQQVENSYLANKLKNPLNGLAIEFRNFGYDDVLGHALSLIQYQNFVVIQSKNNFCLDFKIGTGISYITKKYNKEINPTNNAIGSNLNAKVSFKLEVNKFFKQYHIGVGAELSHFSNGTFQHPNLGLNTLAMYLNVGYNYMPRQVFNSLEKMDKKDNISKGFFIAEGILTISEVMPIPADAKKYPVFAGRFSFSKSLNKTWNYEFGVDAVYNLSNKYKFYDKDYSYKDVPQLGLYAGLSFNYYKSQIIFGMGYYVLDIIKPLGRIYNRVGYRYFFNDKLFGLFNIRANFGKADFFEFGLGFKFKH